MFRSISAKCILVSAACLPGGGSLHGYSQTPTITATSNLVLVPALVQSSSGDFLQSLRSRDFLLTDNGSPQSVTLREVDHQPVAVVVLMQVGASAPRQFPEYSKLGTMLTYLTASSPHQVAMVTFDGQPEDQWDFTPYVADLQDGFSDPHPGDSKAAILDAVRYGIDLLRTRPANERRILVLLSQTHDDGSVAHANDIIRSLGENNITIECFTFAPEKAWLKDQFIQPRQENGLYQFAPNIPPLQHTFNLDKPLREALGALRENTSSTVAALSGGESFSFASRAELEEQFVALTNHLASTYMLDFRPTSKQPGYHLLDLSILGRPDLKVSARTSYWVSNASGR